MEERFLKIRRTKTPQRRRHRQTPDRDLNLHRKVAYKSLHQDLQDSEIETQRFVREARVTANIQHPGTVPVYDWAGTGEDNCFLR